MPFILLFFYILSLFPLLANTQTLGGSSTYNFLKLQQVPHAAALGGRNVSMFNSGISLLSENPALLRQDHHWQSVANFTFLSPSVTGLYGLVGYHEQKTQTNLAIGVSHISYGNEIETDAGGNILGNFSAYDQAVGITASRDYGVRWKYGVTLKMIRSQYGTFASTGLAADAGITYSDTARRMQIGFSIKNMGGQLKTYNGRGEDLPFDMLIGLTKQLEKAPLRITLTAQRLNQFDILYNDTSFNRENYGQPQLAGWGDKLISHLIMGTDLLLGDKIILSAGYNFLRRKELVIRNIASGLTGFGYGLHLNLARMNFHYARSHFQSGLSHHLISVTYRFVQPVQDQK
ncbi:MAG: type IX secretion system protein PorQ [Chitinophagia bacterium]